MTPYVLQEADRNHQSAVDVLNDSIEKEKQHGAVLQSRLDELDATIETQKAELSHILSSFQQFIDRTPGFSPGQSEFVLDQLLPSGFNKFISGSD